MAKKFSTVITVIIMFLGTTACSNNEPSTIVKTEPDTAMEEPENVVESVASDIDGQLEEDGIEQQKVELEEINMNIRVADELEVIFV